MSETKSGFLVLADISGFTAFLTATELEHGPPIIKELLEAVIGKIAPPLEIHGIEGDAIFAVGPDGVVLPPASLREILRAGFEGFRAKQRELAADESCNCRCCRGVGSLRLKAIGHNGPFVEYAVGGRSQLAGPAVILAHRMLKNGVTASDYALLTRHALDYMDLDPLELGLAPHTETYEHFGEIECYVESVA
jgi:hypothetical protein